ncbi:MAG: TIGR04013 family B12-binding domain/radical SAM domain-containing protein [Gammaproteobacteria bacterium]|nr:TIGR04013 family B12-binding domain/radical SAM domain-containing protein [Gammaproteobacteria bacterium]
MPAVNVILNFNKTARFAFNVLVGALEAHVKDDKLNIIPARDKQALQEKLEQAGDTLTLVLWSFYSPQFSKIKKHLYSLKRQFKNPKVIHLAGGVHASAEPLQTLQAGFDYVAVGEGEQIIVDAVRALLADESITHVKGIAWLNNGDLLKNRRGELVDLNDYPPFAPTHKLFGPIEITRGCIYACKFCQTPYISKARFRHRSIENIINYASIMRARGFRDYRFITPTSFSYGSPNAEVNLDAIEELLAKMRETIGKERRLFYGTFPSEIRPEHISRKALRMLKKYVDNDNLIIGGQSGSQALLDSSKRGHTVEAVTEAVKLCIEEGFLPNVDFLYGLPGETKVDVQQTIKYAEFLTMHGARIHNHTFLPLPGTPFQNAAAGTIDKSTQKIIVKMESIGKAYGGWKNQLKKAKELVDLRNK